MAADHAHEDLEEWARMAVRGAAEAHAKADALEVRISALESSNLATSTPPGTTEVKSPGGWRVRASSGVALTLAVLVAVTVAIWQLKALWGIVGRR